jgi:hypothetical protein
MEMVSDLLQRPANLSITYGRPVRLSCVFLVVSANQGLLDCRDHRGMFRLAALVWCSQMLSAPAFAQPLNDSCGSAKTISTSGFTDTEDTTAATTDPQDPAPPNPSCVSGPCADPGGLCRGKSVWYVFTAPTSGTITADTEPSCLSGAGPPCTDYDTILSNYTGSCGSLHPVPTMCLGGSSAGQACGSNAECPNGRCNIGCNDDDPRDETSSKVLFHAEAGTSYHFMVSALNNDGGNLVFHLTFLATLPTATPTVSIKPTATATPTLVPGPLGDANCDGRVTAPDLTALVVLVAANERAPCRLDDTNGDGALNAADIFGVIEAIFGP